MPTPQQTSPTFASRKFNTFINLSVGQIDFRSERNNQRKMDTL